MVIELQNAFNSVQEGIVYRKDTMGSNGFFPLSKYAKHFPHTPAKHVKHYSTSGFEGILGVPSAEGLFLLTLDANIDRMFRTMSYLMLMRHSGLDEKIAEFDRMFPDKDHSMPIPGDLQKYLSLTKEEVKDVVFQTIKINVQRGFLDPNKLVYIRPNFYRDEKQGTNGEVIPGLGVASLGHEVVLEIMAVNVPPYLSSAPADGARVLVFEKALYPKEGDPYYDRMFDGIQSPDRTLKVAANYGAGGRAKNIANAYGCDEALLTDPKGNAIEGGGENIFMVKDGRLITPKYGCLPGTKRALVLNISYQLGIPVEESEEGIPLGEFIGARAAAFSGTWCGFEPIGYVYHFSKGKKSCYHSNNLIRTLKEEYELLISGSPDVDSNLRFLQEKTRAFVQL